MTNYLSRFKFIGNGVYLNDTDNVSIALYDTRKTFRAYRHRNPLYRFIVKNEKGNDVRFRSAEAAAKFLLNKPTEDLPDTMSDEATGWRAK